MIERTIDCMLELLFILGFVCFLIWMFDGKRRSLRPWLRKPRPVPIFPQKRNISQNDWYTEIDDTPRNKVFSEPERALTKTPAPRQYKASRSLLTRTELRFMDTLRQTIPRGMTVAVKVRLADILETERRQFTKGQQADFARIKSKHVDFTICDKHTYEIRAVIELDDTSHNRPDRMARDEFCDRALAEAGIPVMHIQVRTAYDPATIAEAIRTCIEATQQEPSRLELC